MTENEDYGVNQITGEIIPWDNIIGPGGLYTPLGIPAYNVLVQAGEHAANNVLTCLLSHRHAGSNHVWPSIETIMWKTGHGKETIIRANNVLVDFGFISKRKISNGSIMNNHYFIKDACFHSKLLNEKARSYLKPDRSCLVCAKELRPGDYKNYGKKIAHWGCSGNITKSRAKLHIANGAKMADGKQRDSA